MLTKNDVKVMGVVHPEYGIRTWMHWNFFLLCFHSLSFYSSCYFGIHPTSLWRKKRYAWVCNQSLQFLSLLYYIENLIVVVLVAKLFLKIYHSKRVVYVMQRSLLMFKLMDNGANGQVTASVRKHVGMDLCQDGATVITPPHLMAAIIVKENTTSPGLVTRQPVRVSKL